MTPYEITLAYNGYLERMEMMGNVVLMALRQRDAKKPKLITLRTKEEQKNSARCNDKSRL